MKELVEASSVGFGRRRRLEDGMESGQCSRPRMWLNLEAACGEGAVLK